MVPGRRAGIGHLARQRPRAVRRGDDRARHRRQIQVGPARFRERAGRNPRHRLPLDQIGPQRRRDGFRPGDRPGRPDAADGAGRGRDRRRDLPAGAVRAGLLRQRHQFGLEGVLHRPAVPASTTPSGIRAYVYTATATDVAGNSSTGRATFNVAYGWIVFPLAHPARPHRPVAGAERHPVRAARWSGTSGHRRPCGASGSTARSSAPSPKPPTATRRRTQPRSLGVTSGPLLLEVRLDDGAHHPITLNVVP